MNPPLLNGDCSRDTNLQALRRGFINHGSTLGFKSGVGFGLRVGSGFVKGWLRVG